MEADYREQEVVRVHRPDRLLDAESYERRYRIPGGRVLPLGFYVVNWPSEVTTRRFDDLARFVGPFPTRAAAEAAARRDLDAGNVRSIWQTTGRAGSGRTLPPSTTFPDVRTRTG
ncbi:MAG: hypothetical protein GC151_16070 [Betaproteobacteria bacterium]|nr:hypothetical protein [Betaproteobacteria bacterium]